MAHAFLLGIGSQSLIGLFGRGGCDFAKTPPYCTDQTLPLMHSWSEDTEKAIGQHINNRTSTDDAWRASPCQPSGTAMPTPLTAETPGRPGNTHQRSVAEQESSPQPGKPSDKSPFGLKPQPKTALRDFFVCLHLTRTIPPWLTLCTENLLLLNMARPSACRRGRGCLHRRGRDTAGDEHHLW